MLGSITVYMTKLLPARQNPAILRGFLMTVRERVRQILIVYIHVYVSLAYAIYS